MCVLCPSNSKQNVLIQILWGKKIMELFCETTAFPRVKTIWLQSFSILLLHKEEGKEKLSSQIPLCSREETASSSVWMQDDSLTFLRLIMAQDINEAPE